MILAPALLATSGCCKSNLKSAWKSTIARETLECIHPSGIFDSTDPAEVRCGEGSCEILGTIYWRGRATDTNYFSKVKVRAAGGRGTVFLVEENSIIPAQGNCTVPVPPC